MKKKSKKYPKYFIPTNEQWSCHSFVRVDSLKKSVAWRTGVGYDEPDRHWAKNHREWLREKVIREIPESEIALLI